jgi:hemoglobin-like flavoprotein
LLRQLIALIFSVRWSSAGIRLPCFSTLNAIDTVGQASATQLIGGRASAHSWPCTAMHMTPEQTDLIRKSFDAIWPVRRKFAALFYSRFFELAPDAQHLFPHDLEHQHRKLMDMIAAIVGALDQRELFQSLIRNTGQQHSRFGVKSAYFGPFGEALIWSLEQQFGLNFTLELKEAWGILYNIVQIEMRRAAQS